MRAVAVCTALVVLLLGAACKKDDGGGDSGPSVEISGKVQKGLLIELEVTVFPLDPVTAAKGEPIPAVVEGQEFTALVPLDVPLLIEAKGIFTEDITGALIELDAPLLAGFPIADPASPANLNIATTLAANNALTQVLSSGLLTAEQIALSSDLLVEALAMPPNTKLTALDFDAIDAGSTLADPNLQLLLLSGVVSSSLNTGELFGGGFGPVVEAIAAAEQLAGLQAPLSVFQGAPAGPIYDAIQQSGHAGSLPLLDLVDNAIWGCGDGGCGWQPQPGPTISVSSAIVWEADGVASVGVYLGQAAFSPVEVNVRTLPGTAQALFDYEPVETTVTVAANEFVAFAEIPIPIDALGEPTETFDVVISYEGGGFSVVDEKATVTILDGAPPSLTDAAPVDLAIESLCLNGIAPPGEVTATGCPGLLPATVPVSIGNAAAAAVELDLVATCPLSRAGCGSQRRDWLVHYVLVARDGGDVLQGETPLGEYVYRRESVQPKGATPKPRPVQIGLHSAAVIDLMDDAATSGWGLEIEARIGAQPDAIAWPVELPGLVPVPSVVIAGEVTIDVQNVHSAAYGGACAAGELDVTADFGFFPGSGAEATVCIAPGEAGDGEYSGTLTDGSIDLAFIYVGLGDEYVGVTETAEGKSHPFGFPFVMVLPPTLPDGEPTGGASYLHKEGWPFLFQISGGTVTPAGLELEYSSMRYVHTFGYSLEDSRRDGNVHSNDAFYREVAASGVLAVDGNGDVSTGFLVAGGAGHTSFPKADVAWASFPHTLSAGDIADRPGLSISSFSLDQEASCRDAGCLERSARTTSVASAAASIDPRGFVVAPATTLAASPAGWGARTGGDVAWERPDDWNRAGDPATLALPGYRLSRTAAVSKQLLSHLEEGGIEHVVHPLGSIENADGNHFPTGISFGPEIYRDASGVPDVATGQDPLGSVLRIDNGTDTLNLPTPVAAKYVVRNGGITGVFNVDPTALASPATLYGYDLELTRFAVRAVDNQLDDFNWVDGALTLEGDLGGLGGFELHFTNLELNCAARLGRANLAYERCDERDDDGNGVIDENCGHRLWAWSADAETFSMAFGEGGVCDDAPQQLVLDQQVEFEAIDGPMGVQGTWSAAGLLTSQETQLQNAYRLDGREGAEDAVGFPIRPKRGELAAQDVDGLARVRYGWLEMTETLVGVPFWDALESDVRVANRESIGQTVAEPTVMTSAGDLDGQAPNQVNADLQQAFIDDGPAIDAHYGWGNTGFGFTLPVYYSPWQFNREQSKFLGIRQEADLFVLEAGAGIDFIEPVRTKLSFGASADFAKLKGVRFQIDLEDPKSLRAVDSLLVELRIVGAPVIEPALSGLQEDVQILNKYANKGLDEAMQAGLELALEELGSAAAGVTPGGKDPFVTVSEAIAQIKSYPAQVVTIIDDEVRAPIDAALTRHETDLRNELQALEAQVTALQFGQPVPQVTFDALATVRGRLSVIAESVTAANDTISGPIDEADRILVAAAGPVGQLEDAALVIDQLLLQAVSFSKTACQTGDIAGGEGSGYLEDAVIRVASVRRIFSLLESDELLMPLTELLDHDPELRERIHNTRRDMEAKTEELTGFLDEAEAALNDKICDPQVISVLTDARGLLNDITAGARQIDGFLATARVQVAQLEELREVLHGSVVVPVQQLDAALASMQATLEAEADDFRGTTGAFFMTEIDGIVAETSGYTLTAVVLDDGEEGTDVLSLAFGFARRGIHSELDAVRDALVGSVDGLLPGAFYTPEELRRMLVTAIMSSPPVDDLRREMETHLAEINKRVNDLVLQLLDQLNLGVKGALAGVESKVNDALADALAPVRNIPLESVGIDGFGVIAGNELERAHIGAEWTMSPAADGEEPNTFGAALDAVSWSASDKAASCGEGTADGRLDVTISALGLPARVAGSEIVLKKVYLGFNLANNLGGIPPLTVRGVYGGLTVTGDIGFAEAIVYDPAFAAGIGDVETYLGASAGALFSDIQAEVAFLAGRTCNQDILLELDPKVATFIDLPDSGFAGVYLRGAASIPLLTLGCPLTVGVGAEFGSWVLAGPPLTLGGLVGGAAYGKVACAGAIRGQIRALGQVNTDGEWSFAGEGFGAAGVGWCEPSSWTTRARSRDDDWCATGDAFFNASFVNGSWNIPAPEIGAVY